MGEKANIYFVFTLLGSFKYTVLYISTTIT